MEVKWIEYNHQKVLLVDYGGTKLEREMISLLNTIPALLPQDSNETILALSDITGCFATPGFMNAAKKLQKEVLHKYKLKQAIVGIVGAKVILLNAFNMVLKHKTIPFDNRTEALEYLTEK